MKNRYKILIIGIIIVISSSSCILYDYLTEHEGLVYPGITWSSRLAMEERLCERLSGEADRNCFGINDICEDIYGILKYDKYRLEVGCSLANRVDIYCSELQLATGWLSWGDMVCFLPFDDELKESRKVND